MKAVVKTALLVIALCAVLLRSYGRETTKPELIPGIVLQASFVDKTRSALFEPGDAVELWLQVSGWRMRDDRLLWEIRDYEGTVRDAGEMKVPAGESNWDTVLPIEPLGAGYFEVYLKLKNAEVTLPRAGSRPEGFISYGVLPAIDRLPLQWIDDSRFGAQGTTFLQTGKFMQGSPFLPLYPALGLVWAHDGYRMGERESKVPGTFKPLTDPAEWKKKSDSWAKAGLCPLIDLHGLPDWLLAWPEGKKAKYDGPTNTGQSYAPNDWAAFGNYIGNVAREQVARKAALFPRQKHTYYKIHWEPDWHWKGTDEEFIRMYETAHKAIHAADPQGILLGPNYGVLLTGNEHLKRLFKKGLGRYLDGVSTHTYYIPFGLPETRGLPGQVRELIGLTRKYLKPGAKILNTEWGTDYHGKSLFKDHGVLREEMKEFMRGHLIVLGEGVDSTWYFYMAEGLNGGGLMYNLTAPNPVYGAIWVSPKPVAMAAAASTRLLEGTRSLGPVGFLGDGVAAYLFERNGERMLVLWSAGGSPKKIEIPAGVSELRHYDIMGNMQSLPCPGGVASLTISDVPTYLLGLSPSLYADGARVERTLPHGLSGATLTLPFSDEAVDAVAFHNGTESKLTIEDHRLRIPRTLAPGTWLVAEGDQPFVHPGRACLVNVDAPVLVSKNSGGGILLQNQMSEPLQGTLRIHVNGETVFGGDYALKPGESLNAPLPVAALALAKAEPLWVDFADKEGTVSPGPVIINQYIRAKRAQNPPSVDAPLRDWLLEEFVTFDSPDKMRAHSSDWTGPDDLSFRAGFRYDDQRFYIGVKVRDQSHVQTEYSPALWKQDSIQIGLAARPGEKGWEAAQKLTVGLRSQDGVIIVDREPHSSGLTGGPISSDKFQTKVEREGDETTYFLAIPWDEIDPSGKGLPAAGRIGIGLYVNDVDAAGGSMTERKVMEGFGDGMGFFLPERFGVIQLGE